MESVTGLDFTAVRSSPELKSNWKINYRATQEPQMDWFLSHLIQSTDGISTTVWELLKTKVNMMHIKIAVPQTETMGSKMRVKFESS